jgi:hypothetical protein
VYDHDPEEVETLGWQEFIARQWESIFAGYRSPTGLRRMGRRWSDLIEIGPELSVTLLESHARLLTLVRGFAFGQDVGEGLTM